MECANQCASQLRRFLAHQVSDAGVAQDLMQEVYLRILMLKRPEEVRSPRAYLYKVAAHIAYQHRVNSRSGPTWVPFPLRIARKFMPRCQLQ
jgi:DNA-directed RNA polymerase specialized sigma24 family protein